LQIAIISKEFWRKFMGEHDSREKLARRKKFMGEGGSQEKIPGRTELTGEHCGLHVTKWLTCLLLRPSSASRAFSLRPP
jgi:hypothetical protein